MKVLIIDFDLYNEIGGGQTFYRNIIEKNPQIEFFYFIKKESARVKCPVNTRSIPYKEFFYGDFKKVPQELQDWITPVVDANNFALSVEGHHFDVIDLPDYMVMGCMLYPALKRFNVSFSRLAISMHGLISTSIRLNWGSEGYKNRALDLYERMQYQAADLRYAISKSYIDEWEEYKLPVYYLNPLKFMKLPDPTTAPRSSAPPDINFIGRTERRKGPDIFIDLAWWLPRSCFGEARIIGPDSYSVSGVSSRFYLASMAEKRLDVKILLAKNNTELAALYAQKSMTLVPSRYDTFNLVAIESLFSGCPTAIGSGAGVCRFLDESFPRVPYLKIDMNNTYSAIPRIESILKEYDSYREGLVAALMMPKPEADGAELEDIYLSEPAYDKDIRAELDNIYLKTMSFHGIHSTPADSNNSIVIKFKKKVTPRESHNKLAKYRQKMNTGFITSFIKGKVAARWPGIATLAEQYHIARTYYNDRFREMLTLSEKSKHELDEKIIKCQDLGSRSRINRIRLWRELARLEQLRGNDLIAAVYRFRAIRVLGADKFGDLPYVVGVFEKNKFNRESLAADAMYGRYPDNDGRCHVLLNDALEANRNLTKMEFELVDDRRKDASYKVSIIVSLYNAAPKLQLFLALLQNQTLIKTGRAEVVLIDSGSPMDEYSVFKECLSTGQIKMQVVYARSARRETIQSAWNRGISFSRGEYLAFLGVDEAILPDCLETLSDELDRDESLDWIIGNSLVTNVDANGEWLNDIMVYDRTDYKQDLVYLETCYLSWVGALYRRSIHTRFGYYDPTFTAAGDTEFKNRVLPFIKTKAIARTLGLFLNYPDERTTQHPRAEIEDIRAWYLHRSPGGVRYAFSNSDPKDVESLFYTALKYRKSYCRHWSTDIEYAYNILNFIKETSPESLALKYLNGINKLRDVYRSIELIKKPSALSATSALLKAKQVASKVEKHHREINHAVEPDYKIFNDNRYEQHSNIWA